MRILGIETSCDETAVCLIEARGDFDANFSFQILGNALLSQTDVHAPYGGVFPNLAKREHGRNLTPLLGEVLRQANALDEEADTPEEKIQGAKAILEREHELFEFLAAFLRMYGTPPIDAVAVTHGPGLEPALWVGVNFAKALSYVWGKPLIAVNHMEGHVVLSMMDMRESIGRFSSFKFPLLSLLISGGHTELLLSKKWMDYTLIGATRDDAVGEAFDKVARLLDLPYPGGPQISKLAAEARMYQGDTLIHLPRPMLDSDDYDFSFAGIKTAVKKVAEKHQPLSDDIKKQIALEFENACAEVLIAKTVRAVEEYGAETILVGGGVSANTHIRTQLAQTIKDYGLGTRLLIPPADLATDNALMIALAGYFRAQRGEYVDAAALRAQGNLKLAT